MRSANFPSQAFPVACALSAVMAFVVNVCYYRKWRFFCCYFFFLKHVGDHHESRCGLHTIKSTRWSRPTGENSQCCGGPSPSPRTPSLTPSMFVCGAGSFWLADQSDANIVWKGYRDGQESRASRRGFTSWQTVLIHCNRLHRKNQCRLRVWTGSNGKM